MVKQGTEPQNALSEPPSVGTVVKQGTEPQNALSEPPSVGTVIQQGTEPQNALSEPPSVGTVIQQGTEPQNALSEPPSVGTVVKQGTEPQNALSEPPSAYLPTPPHSAESFRIRTMYSALRIPLEILWNHKLYRNGVHSLRMDVKSPAQWSWALPCLFWSVKRKRG